LNISETVQDRDEVTMDC